jgi:hypothetical protein
MSSDNQMSKNCPDCQATFNRREFVKVAGAAAVVAAGGSSLLTRPVWAAPTATSAAETTVKRFYETLSDSQKQTICLPFDHAKRSQINANWHITEPEIEDAFYTNEQRVLINDILKSVTSEDGYERIVKQMDDDSGGIDHYSVAVFGEPGGKFEWVMTGRHLTIRADGDSVANMAFGGPIIYGHGEESPKNNLFYYQTRKANDVFQALDEKQRQRALLPKAPRENEVPIQGPSGTFPGFPVSEMSDDQKELFESAIKTMLAPYRKEDVDEAIAVLKAGGGIDKLHLAFYRDGDLENDQVWDIWRVEGPSFVWHFRGAPHVHTYVNIGLKT